MWDLTDMGVLPIDIDIALTEKKHKQNQKQKRRRRTVIFQWQLVFRSRYRSGSRLYISIGYRYSRGGWVFVFVFVFMFLCDVYCCLAWTLFWHWQHHKKTDSRALALGYIRDICIQLSISPRYSSVFILSTLNSFVFLVMLCLCYAFCLFLFLILATASNCVLLLRRTRRKLTGRRQKAIERSGRTIDDNTLKFEIELPESN